MIDNSLLQEVIPRLISISDFCLLIYCCRTLPVVILKIDFRTVTSVLKEFIWLTEFNLILVILKRESAVTAFNGKY